MPISRYFLNKSDNHAQYLEWGFSSVSCDYATVRYSEVSEINFMFSHSTHSTNFVKNDDTISYFLRIDDVFITRTHSAFNRVSSNARSVGDEIRQEFEGHMNNVYRYIVPGLFQRKVIELSANGKVDIASLVFKDDGSVVIDGVSHRMKDLEFYLSNGQWIIKSKATQTFFGNPKQIATIPMSETNAILIEPMVKLVNSL